MDETFLTVAEIAERMRLNQQTIRNWIDRGELPAIHVGRSVRIRASEFEQFIAASSSARRPKTVAAQKEFDAALAAVQSNTDEAELPTELRRLATAANALARALPGP